MPPVGRSAATARRCTTTRCRSWSASRAWRAAAAASSIDERNGVREHYVRIGERLIAKMTFDAVPPPGGAIAGLMVIDLLRLAGAGLAAGLLLLGWRRAGRLASRGARRRVRVAGLALA